MPRGKLFLILGPSGSGKGTVIGFLRNKLKDAVFPISATTRDPRPGERDGEVYHFLSHENFRKRIAAREFLETAKVHNDNMYGTLKSEIVAPLQQGKIVIREVDMQGVESIEKLLPKDQVVSIFITAPSWENLKQRILGRSKIPELELEERRKSFGKEIKFSEKCDYVVKSEENRIEEFCQEVESIIRRESARLHD